MSKRAEEAALKAYPDDNFVSVEYADMCRSFYQEGYELAEKDLGWVSVKDRLPEESGFQLACIELYGVAQCVGLYYFDAEKKSWIDFDDEVCTVFIDYWMEVPKLPEK